MRILTYILILGLVFSIGGPVTCAYAYDDDDDDGGGGSSALGSALMGGLLGGGLGAAIGSASGNAGKGALIGAGIGAVGGTLMGAAQDDQKAKERQYNRRMKEEQQRYERDQYVNTPEPARMQAQPQQPQAAPTQITKKIVREYDAKGNVISEKEVPIE